jgi:hypothetical protein
MLRRLALYSALGFVLDALGCHVQDPGFWLVVALFWAAEHNTRAEVIDQLDAELEEMRRIAGLIEQRKKEQHND